MEHRGTQESFRRWIHHTRLFCVLFFRCPTSRTIAMQKTAFMSVLLSAPRAVNQELYSPQEGRRKLEFWHIFTSKLESIHV